MKLRTLALALALSFGLSATVEAASPTVTKHPKLKLKNTHKNVVPKAPKRPAPVVTKHPGPTLGPKHPAPRVAVHKARKPVKHKA